MKIAVVIGHTPNGDKGAYSPYLGQSEQPYNLEVAKELKVISPHTYDIYEHSIDPYYPRQQALAYKLNKLDYDLVLELHFNAASRTANGVECLHWFASRNGKKVAQKISKAIANDYGTRIRGKGGSRALVNRNDRGYWFTYMLKATAVIIEPFFGSNVEALEFKDKERYACTLHNALINLNL